MILEDSSPIDEGQPKTTTMNVAGGFTQQLNFYDIAILRAAAMNIYSGLNGSGTLLATYNIPLENPSNEQFNGVVSVPFSGTAMSVVFSGGDQQLVIDDLSFGPLSVVPEPGPIVYSAIGLVALFCVRRPWKKS